ncbi:MAG TPA: TetR/AcrR family transcriptional regulator [Herpetosiphonaceae bacterium]|nr:TetR/AcrR family transcriptional regulator [Herpetosiphonaceae bacterium]
MPKHSREQAATGTRRQAILDAALQVFTAKGLMAATMDDIRAQSGASTGSIYHHFAGKEDLIAALYAEAYQDLHREMRAAFDAAASVADGVRALVEHYLGWFERHERLGRFLLQAAGSEYVAASLPAMQREVGEFEGLVLAWLEPAIAAGAVARLPQSMYVPLIVGPCREIIRRWEAGRASLAEIRQPLAEAVWRSLSGRE